MRKLTAQQIWDMYWGDSVELFVSHSFVDGVTDIAEICKKYVADIPAIYERPYSQEHLDHIAKMMEQYIKEKGIDESKLYSRQDLKEWWDKRVAEILDNIRRL